VPSNDPAWRHPDGKSIKVSSTTIIRWWLSESSLPGVVEICFCFFSSPVDLVLPGAEAAMNGRFRIFLELQSVEEITRIQPR
jgi:hypothetical protein